MAIRPTEDEWMYLEDFAKIRGVKVDTLYNERSRGADFPPSYEFSKKNVRLRRSDVDAWLEKHRRVTAVTQLEEQPE